ncbi:hypothetical protein PTKIN_Ptkin15bG0180800 [Pterospermum kingtungense]
MEVHFLKIDGIPGLYRGFGTVITAAIPAKISQKLMVQGYSGHAKYNGGLDVACKVLKSDGIRGLYRGFGQSVMSYSPSSAVWWASYGSSQRVIWSTGYDLLPWKQRLEICIGTAWGLHYLSYWS